MLTKQLPVMNVLRIACTIGLAFMIAQAAFAQDSITVNDAIEMRVKSESLVKRDLKELLNNISMDDNNQETKDMIFNSHSGTSSKIFWDSKAVIEDDINPGYKIGNSREVTIDKYLSDFDLFYKKGEAGSIFFNDIRTSNVKKVTDIYVKVYFTSLFKNPNKYSDTAYTENNRVAEIRFIKTNKRWVPYITHIAFFNPSDTANDIANDMLLIREAGALTTSVVLTDSAALQAQRNFDQELKEKKEKEEIENYRKQQEQFRNLIIAGDKALEQNDFIGALKAYKDAQDLIPYSPVPPSKINQTKRKQAAFASSKSDLFDQYIKEAALLERKRKYKEALESYQQALEQKPDEASKYQQHINALTNKYRVLSTLEEKYNAGAYKEAIKQYKDANKKEGENSDYYLGIARCYDKMGELKDAMKNYNKSYELDKNNLETIEERAILFKRQNDFVNALTDYRTYVLITKDNVKIFEEMADLKMLINANTDEAIKFLNDGILSNPKSASLYLKKGLLLFQKNDFKEAEKNFTSSIRIDSSSGFAFFNRGKCHYMLRHFKNAADDFESARNAGLEAKYTSEIAAFAEVLFQKSIEKSGQKAMDSALIYVSNAIDINPSNSTYRFNRGDYLFSVNKLNDAIRNYTDAIQLTANYTDSYFKRGWSHVKLKEYTAAIADLRSADSLNHQLYLASKYMGDSYYALADFSHAAAAYESSLQIMGNVKTPVSPELYAEIYNLLGEAYYKLGNYEKAIAQFKSAIRKNGVFALAFYNKGLAYYKTNELANAIEDISKATSLERTNYEWFYTLANAYQDKKEYLKASQGYDLCINLDTLHRKGDALYNKGYCNYQLQNWSEALKDYQNFQLKNPGHKVQGFNMQLGVIYLNVSNKDSAYNCFFRDYLQDSTNGVAMFNIGRTLYFKGKTDEAMVWFDKAFQTKMVSKSDIKKERINDPIWDDKKFKPLRSKYF